MAFSYDLQKRELTFSIGDFSPAIQNELFSTLDINGFISNEKKFRETVANNLNKLVTPKLAKKLSSVVTGGQLLPLTRDPEHLGLNFSLNSYRFSLDVMPGRPELHKEGTKVLSIIGIAKDNDFYLTALEDENGHYRYTGRVKPFLVREKLYAEPIDESDNVLWVDPKKTKKVKVKHAGMQLLLQDTFDITDKVVRVGKKLSAVFKDIEALEFVDDRAVVSQLMASKFNINWQIARVKARDIKDPQEKIAFVLDFLNKEANAHNYGRVLNWLKMTRLGYKERNLFDEAIASLKQGKKKYASVEDKETPLAEVPTADLRAVHADLLTRKYDFQFKSIPKAHTEFMRSLEKEIQARDKEPGLSIGPSGAATAEEPEEAVTTGKRNLTLRVLTADPFTSNKWIIDVTEDRKVVARINASGSLIKDIHTVDSSGEMILDSSGLSEQVTVAVTSLVSKYTKWASTPKILLEKRAHCGPCTPLKMKVIELLSDMHYKFNNFDRKFLGQLAAHSEEESNEVFVQTLNNVLATIKEEEDTKNTLTKLRQISTTLQDVQYRIDDGEFEMVDKPHAHKEASFTPSLGRQPFWDQHADGHTSDTATPLENLYPSHTQVPEESEEKEVPEYNDTWNAFTKIDAKTLPALLLKLFKMEPINKSAEQFEDLRMDPHSLMRIDLPEIKFMANLRSEGKDVPHKFRAKLLKKTGKANSFIDDSGEAIPETPRLKDSSDIFYMVTLADTTLPIVVGVFDAKEILQYSIKKGQERKTVTEWLQKNIEDKKEEISSYINKAIAYEQNPSERKAGTFWKILLEQQLISNDFEGAMDTATKAGMSPFATKGIVEKHFNHLIATHQQNAALDLVKKYQTYNPKSDYTISGHNVLKPYMDLAAGNDLPKAPKLGVSDEEYQQKINFILYGNESKETKERAVARKDAEDVANKQFSKEANPEEWKKVYRENLKKNMPDDSARLWGEVGAWLPGGSPEAKILALKDMPGSKLEEFIKSTTFLKQPWMVQFEALGSAIALAKGKGGARLDRSLGTEILRFIFENPELSFSLRKPAFDELIKVHGLGLSKEHAQGGYTTILGTALQDPDPEIRANAYQVAIEKHLPILPWDTKGKLFYDTSDKKTFKEIVQREIPNWLIKKLETEAQPTLRQELAKLVTELPKDLVTEKKKPEFELDPTSKVEVLMSPGAYSFNPETVTNSVKAFILAVLHNEYPAVRAVARSHFGLTPEKPVEKEKKIVTPPEATVEHWIMLGEKEIHRALASYFAGNVDAILDASDVVEKYLESAKATSDASKHEQPLTIFKFRVDSFDLLGKMLKGIRDSFTSLKSFSDFIRWAFKDRFQPLEDIRKPGYQIYGPIISRQELLFRDLDKLIDIVEYIRAHTELRDRWSRGELPLPSTEQKGEEAPELPLGKPEISKEWGTEEFKKIGKIVESRQPPTTWPMKDPQVGYSAAFPIAPKDDGLLAKDVEQFIGRPRGKWRSYLAELWKILFDNVEIDKQAAAETPTSDAEANALLVGNFSQAKAGLDYYFNKQDEQKLAETVPILNTRDKSALLFDLINYSMEKNLQKPLAAILSTPGIKGTIYDKVLEGLAARNDISALEKLLDTFLADKAVSVLAKSAPDRLKERYRIEVRKNSRYPLQTRIVFELGALGDDLPFFKEVLNSEHQEARHQALEYLTHYGHFDVLKEQQAKETDPDTKKLIDTSLARYESGEASKYVTELSGEDLEKEISKLEDIATKAFTRWEQYPEIRRKVLGDKRYPHTDKFEKWKENQKLIDKEISQQLDKLPSLDAGKKALDGLKKLAEDPQSHTRIARILAWISQKKKLVAEEQAQVKELEDKVSEEPDGAITQDINKRKRALEDMEGRIQTSEQHVEELKNSVANLLVKVRPLEHLYLSAVNKEKEIETLMNSQAFRKRFPMDASWVAYKAHEELLTDETKTSAKEAKKTSDLVWKFSEPLREACTSAEKERSKLAKDLTTIYKHMRLFGHNILVNDEGDPVSPEINSLENKLKKYIAMEQEWFKQAAVLEPFVEMDDSYYKLMNAQWVYPRANQLPLSPQGHGVLLQPERVAEVKSDYSDTIEALRKEIKQKRTEFFRELKNSLEPKGRKVLEQYEKARRTAETSRLSLREMGIAERGDEFVSSWGQRVADKKKKEEYDEWRKTLSKKLETIKELKEANPAEYVRILAEKELFKKFPSLELFRKEYGILPLPDTASFELFKQWRLDRWRGPFLAGKRPPSFPGVVSDEDLQKNYQEELNQKERLIIERGPSQTDLQGYSAAEYNRLLKEGKPTEAAYYWWWMHFGGFTAPELPAWKRNLSTRYKFHVAPPHDPDTYAKPPWQDPATYGVAPDDRPTSRAESGEDFGRHQLGFKGTEKK